MSILATYASEYKNSINDENNFSSNTGQKKKTKNKTLKKKPLIKDNAKMEAMMNKIHNFDEEEDEDELGNFEPISPPAISKSGEHEVLQSSTSSKNNENSKVESFSELPSEYAKQYYEQYVPYMEQNKHVLAEQRISSQSTQSPTFDNVGKPTRNSNLQTKVDYLIQLLENQSNEKSSDVMEELILYSFLGIFTIFIVDSFARVGKYIR